MSARPRSTDRWALIRSPTSALPRSELGLRASISPGVISMLDPGRPHTRSTAATSRTASSVARLPDGPIHPGLDLGPSRACTRSSSWCSGRTEPPLSSWRARARARVPVGRRHLAVDQVGQHRVDQAFDLDPITGPAARGRIGAEAPPA